MKLQSDWAILRPVRRSRILRHYDAVQRYTDQVFPNLDQQSVPARPIAHSRLGLRELIYAPGNVVIDLRAVIDVHLVSRACGSWPTDLRINCILRAKRVANRNSAVSAQTEPVFERDVVVAVEFALCVKPGLRKARFVRIALANQDSSVDHGPDSESPHFPAGQVAPVQQIFPRHRLCCVTDSRQQNGDNCNQPCAFQAGPPPVRDEPATARRGSQKPSSRRYSASAISMMAFDHPVSMQYAVQDSSAFDP